MIIIFLIIFCFKNAYIKKNSFFYLVLNNKYKDLPPTYEEVIYIEDKTSTEENKWMI